MRRGLALVLLLGASSSLGTACSGLHSGQDGGTDAAGGSGGQDAGAPDGGGPDGGCSLPSQCPQPPNSSAVCSNGACSLVCAVGYLNCTDQCCVARGIAAGTNHTCAITSADTVKCWGAAGTIGDGFVLERLTPTDVVGLTGKPRVLSAGYAHTCALLDTGVVECWGANAIGDGNPGLASQAKRVIQAPPVQGLAMGGSFGCLLVDGGVRCWGTDAQGQQGTNGGGLRLAPGDVPGLAYDVKQLAVGMNHGCAVLTDGGARCWGFNISGECGDQAPFVQRNAPVQVTALDAGIVRIHGGWSFTCAELETGRVKCWGVNAQGECGAGSTTSRFLLGTDLVGVGPGLTQLALGAVSAHACYVQDGGAWCWGNDDHGQLGDGTLTDQRAPVRVQGLSGSIRAVAPGGSHTCALTEAGAVYCWGNNGSGQIGDASKGGDRLVPYLVR